MRYQRARCPAELFDTCFIDSHRRAYSHLYRRDRAAERVVLIVNHVSIDLVAVGDCRFVLHIGGSQIESDLCSSTGADSFAVDLD